MPSSFKAEIIIHIQYSERWHPTSVARCQKFRNRSSLIHWNAEDSGWNGQETVKGLDLTVGQVVVEVHASMDVHRQSDHTWTKFLMGVSYAPENENTSIKTNDF